MRLPPSPSCSVDSFKKDPSLWILTLDCMDQSAQNFEYSDGKGVFQSAKISRVVDQELQDKFK
jgi:hypothetical protein